jgi:hypothetical protein
MNTKTQKTVNKEVKNQTSRIENLIILNEEVNLLKDIKETEKTLELDKKNQISEAKKSKSKNKKEIKAFWLEMTRSKNAIKKFISENSELINPLLNDINIINNTTFDVGVFNGTLENYALIQEVNKVDINGKIVEEKNDVRTIGWYLELLERKAKYIDYTSDKFEEYKKDRLNKFLTSKTTTIASKTLFNAKAELSQANYNKVVKEWKGTNTDKLNNYEYIQSLENIIKKYTTNKLMKK